MSDSPLPSRASLVTIAGLLLTALVYLITATVWGIRLEGRISTIEIHLIQTDRRSDDFDENGSRKSRLQLAVLDQRIGEISRGFTPYGVQNLEKRVQEIEINRAAIFSEMELRMKKIEEMIAKAPIFEQRLAVLDERGTKEMPALQRRVTQLEILFDNLRLSGQLPIRKLPHDEP